VRRTAWTARTICQLSWISSLFIYSCPMFILYSHLVPIAVLYYYAWTSVADALPLACGRAWGGEAEEDTCRILALLFVHSSVTPAPFTLIMQLFCRHRHSLLSPTFERTSLVRLYCFVGSKRGSPDGLGALRPCCCHPLPGGCSPHLAMKRYYSTAILPGCVGRWRFALHYTLRPYHGLTGRFCAAATLTASDRFRSASYAFATRLVPYQSRTCPRTAALFRLFYSLPSLPAIIQHYHTRATARSAAATRTRTLRRTSCRTVFWFGAFHLLLAVNAFSRSPPAFVDGSLTCCHARITWLTSERARLHNDVVQRRVARFILRGRGITFSILPVTPFVGCWFLDVYVAHAYTATGIFYVLSLLCCTDGVGLTRLRHARRRVSPHYLPHWLPDFACGTTASGALLPV